MDNSNDYCEFKKVRLLFRGEDHSSPGSYICNNDLYNMHDL